MNDILKTKSYRLLQIVINVGFWIAVVLCIGIWSFFFITNLFGWNNDAFRLSIINYSGSGFVISNNAHFNLSLPLWATSIALMLVSAVGIFILWELRCIVRSIGNGSPFIFQNVKRMRLVAFAIFVQSYGLMIVGYFAAQHHRIVFEESSLQPFLNEKLELFPTGALIALFVLVLAEIFRYGCILQHAYDTTV